MESGSFDILPSLPHEAPVYKSLEHRVESWAYTQGLVIIREVGRGAQARVFQCMQIDKEHRRYVPKALKYFASFSTPSERERFMRGVGIGQKLAHPNVVKVFEYGEEDGAGFQLCEWLSGQTLAAFMAAPLFRQLVPERRLALLAPFLLQVLEGLRAFHGLGIVHCDVKPGNIMLSGSRAVLCDLGGLEFDGSHAPSVFGTPFYMAPELFGGRPCFASDLYSFGVLLYEVATSELPFGGEHVMALALAHRYGFVQMKRLRHLQPDFQDLIKTLLSKRPSARGSLALAAEFLHQASDSQKWNG